MGFDPTRKRTARAIDYLIVGAAMILILGLVIWALIG